MSPAAELRRAGGYPALSLPSCARKGVFLSHILGLRELSFPCKVGREHRQALELNAFRRKDCSEIRPI